MMSRLICSVTCTNQCFMSNDSASNQPTINVTYTLDIYIIDSHLAWVSNVANHVLLRDRQRSTRTLDSQSRELGFEKL